MLHHVARPVTKRHGAPISQLLIRFDCLMGTAIPLIVRVRSTLNLSLNGRDHKLAVGLDDVSTFIVAKNARASLMGRVVAFLHTEILPAGFPLKSAWPFRVRSTEKDNGPDVGLEIGV